jgi:hypothetical protein
VDAGWDFETEETTCFAVRFYVIEEEGGNFLIFAEVFKGRKLDVVFLGPFLNNGLFRDNNSNYVSLKGITINKDLSDVSRLAELLFNLVRSNILALSKLENILLSVNDLKCTISKEDTNITSVNPTFFIDAILSLFWLTEIALEVVVALIADLSSGGRTAVFVLILGGVVHVRDVNQLDIKAFVRTSDVAASRILSPSDGSGSTALSLTIALKDLAAEGDLEEFEDLLGDRS